jgi:membrane protease YdiL (CAAX protease family)
MSGPWSEEFGWRGVALDPLMKRFGRIPAGLYLGLIWGIWHLPLFFMPETGHGKLGFGIAGFPMFIVYSLGLSLLMMWVFTNTGRSILAAMLVHFTSNFASQLADPSSDRVGIIRAILILLIGLSICIWMERQDRVQAKQAVAGV